MRKLERWVGSASPRLELLIVVLVAFSYFSISSLFSLFSKHRKVLITGEDLILLLVYEITVLLVLGWFLKKRGWTLTRFGGMPSWKSTVMGAGLIPTVYVIYALIWIAVTSLFPEIQSVIQSKFASISAISLWIIILISIINPIFEEIFVCGYIIHFLKRSNSLWIAVIVSTSIRTLYHLYQPIQGVVFIISLGLVFGFFYAKTNRLWSVVAAHAFFDLYGLLRSYND